MIFVVLAIGLVACIGVWLVLRLRQNYDYGVGDDPSDAPALVIPVRASAHSSVEPLPPPPPVPVTPLAAQAPAVPSPRPPRLAQRAQEHSTAPFRPPAGYQPPEYQPTAAVGNGAPANGTGTENADGGLGTDKVIHTIPVTDGTLQFLPGRLEIIDGEKRGRDIRFVRTWGEVPEITFGRVTGPPYRHVQLRSQTVSRQHARMQYVDGRWHLVNLSQTNPVIVNGEMLEPIRGQIALREGDQIEMGEVIFRFRER